MSSNQIEAGLEESSELEQEVELKEHEQNESDESTEPFDPKLIDIGVEVKSLDSIIARIKNNEIDMNPDFQRHADLWDKKRMSRLIESILIRFPLPAFYFDASNDNNWLVVDGLQRLSAIRKFVIEEDKGKALRLIGLEFLKELNGKNYDELDRMYQRRIAECNINTYLIKPGTPENVKYSVFRRVNTGGLTLNNQEIRNAMAQPKDRKFLEGLAENNNLKAMIGDLSKRMQDQELILRFVAFFTFEYPKTRQMTLFLDDAMDLIRKNEHSAHTKIKETFELAIKTCHQLLDVKGFEKKPSGKNRKITTALFEVWMVVFAKLDASKIEKLLNAKEIFQQKKKELYADLVFINAVSVSTQKKEHVDIRYTKVNKLIEDTIND